MSNGEEGIVITNTVILKRFKRWAWALVLLNVFTVLTTIAVLGSMQQLYGKIQRLHISNNRVIDNFTQNYCLISKEKK